MIIKYEDLPKFKKQKTVYTAGCFDIIHSGHIKYLGMIKRKYPNHKLVCSILPDSRVKIKKGFNRPVLAQNERLVVMDAIKYVDYVFAGPNYKNGADDTLIILEKLKPNIVVYTESKYLKLKKDFEKYGSQIIIMRSKVPTTTTKIINKIKKIK